MLNAKVRQIIIVHYAILYIVKELPSQKLIDVEKEYNEIFVQKYTLLLTRFQSEDKYNTKSITSSKSR